MTQAQIKSRRRPTDGPSNTMTKQRYINERLMVEYLELIDPSGEHPIAVGYRLGPKVPGAFKHHVAPNAQGVVDWADSKDPAGHMWIGPAPRISHTARIKGDAAFSWVIWADFDQHGKYNPSGKPLRIPDALRPHVWLVRSGTPGNYHVYVPLARPIKDWKVLAAANYLLRQVIRADTKYSDESLLRLPGSVNAKNGAQVVPEGALRPVRRMTPVDAIRTLVGLSGCQKGEFARLCNRLAAGVRNRDGNHDLTVVDVPAERLNELARQDTPEHRQFRISLRDVRNGQFRVSRRRPDRSAARGMFWKDFWRVGLTRDETYSLMVGHDAIQFGDWEGDLIRCWGKYENGSL